ncbi:MAG: isoleucine--tRNA ligase [Frankiaceae bacterium]
MISPLPPRVDLPALEREVLERWERTEVFQRSLARTADGPRWVFYEGPPTANGKPGAHHTEARAVKDIYCRYKTMQGYSVPRRAGWDCHGLPVELAVEKELGFTGKADIEAYGVAEFNARCRESVLRHVAEFERMTSRLGYWCDMANAYRTMDPHYIESVWWSLKVIYNNGLLVQDHRVSPYCPRCGTGLSDHEVAQGYLTVTDPSVYVRFPITSGRWAGEASLLVWTTTPWTLISNTAVAVHPDVTYVAARVGGGEVLIVAEPLLSVALGEAVGENADVLARFPGRELEHVTYSRPFDLVDIPGAHYVGLADYVTIEDGTGLVHQAPAFGAEDLDVARRYGLPVVNPVGLDGHFAADLPLVGGQFFKAADAGIVADLRKRGLLYSSANYVHSYPHCWRCDTPLIYYALPSWYIRTTAIKDALLRENEATDWHPARVKTGRYGDWLANNVDWALSRNRYWGTPLPIWRCPADHLTVVGSLAELSACAGRDLSDLDPHRPFIDEITFRCPVRPEAGSATQCGDTATRVPEVIDVWYDAGSMPFAQWGAPHRNLAEFEAAYPAQFIVEALDQTRGWFYTLMAIGTLVFDKSSYQTVLCLGLILDEQGRKMSKHLGNVVDPFDLFDRHGADAVRWLMLCGGSPWSDRRVGDEPLAEVVRKVLLTYWNTVSFFTLYANVNGWTPQTAPAPEVAQRPALDRWALSELHATVIEVTGALDTFDSARAGRRLSAYIDDLSNWYVRRSRRRFWAGDPSALATLHECLEVLTRLLAPFVPFVADAVHERIVGEVWPDLGDSVHLRDWPKVDGSLVDAGLAASVALARRLVELGRSARASGKTPTRQPLGRALVVAPGWEAMPEELRSEVLEELNVLAVESGQIEVDVSVKPNFRELGRRYGPRTKAVAAAIAAAPAAEIAAALERDSTAAVDVDGAAEQLSPSEVIITEIPRQGWAVAAAHGETLALDLTVTPELRRAGRLREVVRLVQDARKSTNLDVADRIEVWWRASDPETAQALREGSESLAGEVLAVAITEGEPLADLAPHAAEEFGLTFWLRVVGG